MIALITRNEWTNPLQSVRLLSQKKRLHNIAKKSQGYRGLRSKWTFRSSYFMTLWKSEEDLNAFMALPEVQAMFDDRIRNLKVNQIRMSAINFIPWIEVVALMNRNSTRVTKPESLVQE